MVQKSHKQITPKPGWVENDPLEIMKNVKDCINQVVANAEQKHKVNPKDIIAAGVTNQRETTIPWVFNDVII
jgi:glycerol kinase